MVLNKCPSWCGPAQKCHSLLSYNRKVPSIVFKWSLILYLFTVQLWKQLNEILNSQTLLHPVALFDRFEKGLWKKISPIHPSCLLLLQLSALLWKNLHGCDRDGCPVSQGKMSSSVSNGTICFVWQHKVITNAFMSSPYQISFPPPFRGRPQRQCEGLCVCWLQALAGSTESARRPQNTTSARQTSSWSLSRSFSAPMT